MHQHVFSLLRASCLQSQDSCLIYLAVVFSKSRWVSHRHWKDRILRKKKLFTFIAPWLWGHCWGLNLSSANCQCCLCGLTQCLCNSEKNVQKRSMTCVCNSEKNVQKRGMTCVCVNHLKRCKTCFFSRGAQKAHRAVPNEALYGVLRISRLITWTYLHFFQFSSMASGQAKNRHVEHWFFNTELQFISERCWCPFQISRLHSLHTFTGFRFCCCFARLIHSSSWIRMAFLYNCVTHVGSTRWHEPFGKSLSRE